MTLLLTLALAALHAAPLAPTAPACPITLAPVPVRLADGGMVTIEPSTMVANGREILVLGQPTTLWSPGAGRRALPRSQTEAIGVIVDVDGRAHPVPPPLGVPLSQARALRAGNGVWDVLFISGKPGVRLDLHTYDTATIWLGQLAQRKWRNVRPIARARGALLLADFSSALVRRGKELAIAYPFDHSLVDSASPVAARGIVMLRGNGAAWREDTLPLRFGARTTQVVVAGDGNATVFFASHPIEAGNRLPQAIFAALHTPTGWRPPRVVISDSGHIHLIDAVATPRGTLVTWRAQDPTFGSAPDQLYVTTLSPTLRATPRRSLGIGNAGSRPVAIPFADRGDFALTPDGSAQALRAYFLGDTQVTPPSQLAAPISLPRLRATALDDMRAALWTTSEGADASEPYVVSHLMLAQLRCGSTRERQSSHSSRESGEPHARHSTTGSRPHGAAPQPYRLRGPS